MRPSLNIRTFTKLYEYTRICIEILIAELAVSYKEAYRIAPLPPHGWLVHGAGEGGQTLCRRRRAARPLLDLPTRPRHDPRVGLRLASGPQPALNAFLFLWGATKCMTVSMHSILSFLRIFLICFISFHSIILHSALCALTTLISDGLLCKFWRSARQQ